VESLGIYQNTLDKNLSSLKIPLSTGITGAHTSTVGPKSETVKIIEIPTYDITLISHSEKYLCIPGIARIVKNTIA